MVKLFIFADDKWKDTCKTIVFYFTTEISNSLRCTNRTVTEIETYLYLPGLGPRYISVPYTNHADNACISFHSTLLSHLMFCHSFCSNHGNMSGDMVSCEESNKSA